jgi:hypothetical protein
MADDDDEKDKKMQPNRMSQEMIVKARSHKQQDTKKEFVLGLMEAKKRATTKVVNFSFGFTFIPQKKPMEKGNMTTAKVNFFNESHGGR